MEVFDLELYDTCYYIKRRTIVQRISFDNRTFYAKFERIEEPLTPLLLTQHLQRDYTIAVPLLQEGKTRYLVIEYKGDEAQRFCHLTKYLLPTLGIPTYHLYQGAEPQKIQLFIPVEPMKLSDAHKQLTTLSNALQAKLTKRWKTLPSPTLPNAYNIVTLPYAPL